jgi:hypothetical protein
MRKVNFGEAFLVKLFLKASFGKAVFKSFCFASFLKSRFKSLF